MKSKMKLLATGLLMVGIMAFSSLAGAVELPFEIPPIPWPPMILSVANTAAKVGQPTIITVTAKGDMQLLWNDDSQLFEEAPPGDVGGHNPTLINKVYVYYTKDPLMEGFVNPVSLTCVAGCDDEEGSTWQGQIPGTVHTAVDETVYYFIALVDTFGNVAFETPDPAQGPATHNNPSAGTWGATNISKLQAPYINNDVTGCTSGSTYAVCDQLGDAKGFGGAAIPEVDVKGVNLGVDAASIYLNMDLNSTSIPKPGGYIEAYALAFFNPDAQDPNPYDTQFYKGYAVLYAPELTTLPEMIQSLWDAECLTDPNSPDLFACRITTCGTGTDCVLESVGNKLFFSVKHSSGGNNIFGSASEANSYAKMVAAAAQVDLNSPDIFVLSDYCRGASYYKRRHSYNVGIGGPPDAVILTGAASESQGAYDQCSLTWIQSPEPDAAGYFIYRALSKTAATDQITKLTSSPLTPITTTTYTDTTQLAQDGTTYWYFVAARNTANQIITPTGAHESDCSDASCPFSSRWIEIQNQARGCATTDTIAPVKPVISLVETVKTKTEQLTIYFTAGNPNDPTLDRFMVYLSGQPVSTNALLWIGDQTYTITVEKEYIGGPNLTNGTQYCFTAKAFDKSDNVSESSVEVCGTPRDRESPANTKNLAGSAKPDSQIANVKVKLTWETNTEEDFGAYKIYECKPDIQTTMAPCKSSGATVPAAYNLTTPVGTITDINTASFEKGGFDNEDNNKYFCYVIVAFDNVTPTPNPEDPESHFPIQPPSAQYPYGSPCVLVKNTPDNIPPGGTTTSSNTVSEEDGSSIKVEWTMITKFSGGTDFACAPNCISAGDWLGDELTSYVITAVESGDTSFNPSTLQTSDHAFDPYICAIVPGPNFESADCKTFLDHNPTGDPPITHTVEIGKTYTVTVWGRDTSDNISPVPETTGKSGVLVDNVVAPDPPEPVAADVTAVKDMGYIYFGFNKSPSETTVYKPLYKVYRCIDSDTNHCDTPATATMTDVTPTGDIDPPNGWAANADTWLVSAPESGDSDYLTGYTSTFYFKEDVSTLPDYMTNVYYYYLKAVNPYHPTEYISGYSSAVVTDLGLIPPTGFVAYTENQKDVLFTWTRSEECESPTSCPALTGYKLYHCNASGDCDSDSNYSAAATITPATLAAYTLMAEAAGDWYYKLTSIGSDGSSESALGKSTKAGPVHVEAPECTDPTGEKCINVTITNTVSGCDINIAGGLDIKIYDSAGTTLITTGHMESNGTSNIDLNATSVIAGNTVKLKLVLAAGAKIMHGTGVTELSLCDVVIASEEYSACNATITAICTPSVDCPKVGDVTYSGGDTCTVNGQDFTGFRPQYNKPCDDPDNCPTDFNKDGTTNGQDFNILKKNYNFSSGD